MSGATLDFTFVVHPTVDWQQLLAKLKAMDLFVLQQHTESKAAGAAAPAAAAAAGAPLKFEITKEQEDAMEEHLNGVESPFGAINDLLLGFKYISDAAAMKKMAV